MTRSSDIFYNIKKTLTDAVYIDNVKSGELKDFSKELLTIQSSTTISPIQITTRKMIFLPKQSIPTSTWYV